MQTIAAAVGNGPNTLTWTVCAGVAAAPAITTLSVLASVSSRLAGVAVVVTLSAPLAIGAAIVAVSCCASAAAMRWPLRRAATGVVARKIRGSVDAICSVSMATLSPVTAPAVNVTRAMPDRLVLMRAGMPVAPSVTSPSETPGTAAPVADSTRMIAVPGEPTDKPPDTDVTTR